MRGGRNASLELVFLVVVGVISSGYFLRLESASYSQGHCVLCVRRNAGAVHSPVYRRTHRDALDGVESVESFSRSSLKIVVSGHVEWSDDELGRCCSKSNVRRVQSAVGRLTREMHRISCRSLHAGVPMEESWNGAMVASTCGMRSWSRLGVPGAYAMLPSP